MVVLVTYTRLIRGGSRTAATSKMERFVTAVLDAPLHLLFSVLFSLQVLITYNYFPFHCMGGGIFGCLNTHIVLQTWVRVRVS